MLYKEYDESVDVYSYGLVLAELISRIAPSLKDFSRVPPEFGIYQVSLFLLILRSLDLTYLIFKYKLMENFKIIKVIKFKKTKIKFK
jgi:hypothetical protein